MGLPIPFPLECPPCPNCWGLGKPFAGFWTPCYIQATITGMKTGPLWNPGLPDPPNGFYELLQFSPCIWSTIIGIAALDLIYYPATTLFTINYPGLLNIFLGWGDPCVLTVNNTNPDWPGLYQGGTASWTWLGGP